MLVEGIVDKQRRTPTTLGSDTRPDIGQVIGGHGLVFTVRLDRDRKSIRVALAGVSIFQPGCERIAVTKRCGVINGAGSIQFFDLRKHMKRGYIPVRAPVEVFIQVASGQLQLKSRAQLGTRVDVAADDYRVVAVDILGPVGGPRLQLDVAPVLIIDTGVHDQAVVQESRLFADL